MEPFETILKSSINYIKKVVQDLGYANDEELIQVGRISLYESYMKFEEGSVPFMKYAGSNIRYDIMNYLSDFTRTIKIPKKIVHKNLKKDDEDKEFNYSMISTDKPVHKNESDGAEIMDVGDFLTEPIEESVYSEFEIMQVKNALKKLTPKQREVIEKRCGINQKYDESFSLAAIGAELGGLCRERTRQIENDALTELRRILTGTATYNPVKKEKSKAQINEAAKQRMRKYRHKRKLKTLNNE